METKFIIELIARSLFSVLRFSLFVFPVLLLELLGVMPNGTVVDLHVAHGHQGGQHRLDDLLPVLQYSYAMDTNLQC